MTKLKEIRFKTESRKDILELAVGQ